MAYDSSKLALIALGGDDDFKLFFYKSTADTLATILASGYFTGAETLNMLTAGSAIMVWGTDGMEILRVDTNDGTTITTEIGFGGTQWMNTGLANLSNATSKYIVAPFDGVVRRHKLVTNGEIDTTTTITLKKGGIALTGGTITLDQSGQGAGEVYEGTCTALNTVSEGDAIQVDCDGAATAAANANEEDAELWLEFVPI